MSVEYACDRSPSVAQKLACWKRGKAIVERHDQREMSSVTMLPQTTPFCVVRWPISKTYSSDLHIGGANERHSGKTFSIWAKWIDDPAPQFVSG